jgi:hypothetical protein
MLLPQHHRLVWCIRRHRRHRRRVWSITTTVLHRRRQGIEANTRFEAVFDPHS